MLQDLPERTLDEPEKLDVGVSFTQRHSVPAGDDSRGDFAPDARTERALEIVTSCRTNLGTTSWTITVKNRE